MDFFYEIWLGPLELMETRVQRSKPPLALLASLGMMLFAQASTFIGPAYADERQAPQPISYSIQPESDQPASEIGKGYFSLHLNPGQTKEIGIVVKNTGSELLSIRSYAVDGVQLAAGGIDFSNRNVPPNNTGTWMKIEPEHLTLDPGEAQRVRATIQVPDSTAVGDFVGGIAVEDEQVYGQGDANAVSIRTHYRKVLATVVTTPGTRAPSLMISGTTLMPSAQGSRALVDMRNSGNVLLKGSGTIEIGGGQAGTGALPFTLGTMLPASGAQVAIDLPNVSLEPGTYDVRLQFNSPEFGSLAAWNGSVAMAPAPSNVSAPPQTIALQPVEGVAPSAGENVATGMSGPSAIMLVAGTAVTMLMLGIAGGGGFVLYRRRRKVII